MEIDVGIKYPIMCKSLYVRIIYEFLPFSCIKYLNNRSFTFIWYRSYSQLTITG